MVRRNFLIGTLFFTWGRGLKYISRAYFGLFEVPALPGSVPVSREAWSADDLYRRARRQHHPKRWEPAPTPFERSP